MTATTNKQILRPFYTEYAADPTGWTTPINGNWDIIDSAFGGTHTVTMSSSNVTLTDVQCQNLKIQLGGSIGATNLTVFFPAGISGLFVVENLTSGTGVVTLACVTPGGSTRTAVRGANTLIWLDAATNGITLADNSPVTGGIGITVDGSTIDLDVPVTVPNGGTGQTTYSPGQLLIGNNAGGLTPATLTKGANIDIVNGNGTITISAVGSAGGVTTVSGGTTGLTPNTPSAGDVVLSGTLNVANGGTGLTTLTAANNTIYSTSSSAFTVGTLPVAAGGTGATTLTANNVVLGNGTSAPLFVAPGTNGNVLSSNGTTWVSTAPGGAGNLTGAVTSVGLATSLGSFTSANLATALTDETGTGANVFATSPTLVSPILGTPTSGVMTNVTGLPLTTGVTGTLPVTNGGTGATTLTGYVKGNATSAMTASPTIPGSDLSGAYTASGLTVASNRLLGRASGGSGAAEEIAIGTGLSISGGTLNLSGGSGVTSLAATSSATGFSLSASASTGAVTVTYGVSSAPSARTTLGLGTIATQDSSSVSITGGTISGASSIAASGAITSGTRITAGTGGSTVAGYVFSSGGSNFTSTGTDANLNFTANTSIFSGTSGSTIGFSINSADTASFSSTIFRVGPGITAAQCTFGANWTVVSDARVKTDVTPYALGTAAVNQLRPVSYIYNGDYGTPDNGVIQTGLIAQEVLTTQLASMVGTYVYTDPQTGEQTTLYDLNTNQLVFALVNAVKELSARVTALEAK
jgi:hypothetical protein